LSTDSISGADLLLRSFAQPARANFPAPQHHPSLTLCGWSNYFKRGLLRSHALFQAAAVLSSMAEQSWQIAPASRSCSSRAFALPNQLDRITGSAYTNDPAREMAGGVELQHAPTMAYRLRNLVLQDGSLYRGNVRLDLHSRSRLTKRERLLPRVRLQHEVEQASLYSSYDGHEFFGLWLTDDCPNYLLASQHGQPVAPTRPASPHMLAYEQLLSMNPFRSDSAYLHEAVFFDDVWGNSLSKKSRLAAVRARILALAPNAQPHPGVFLLRRDSGKSRVMENELEAAQHLASTRGFRIADVTRDDVPSLMQKCAGARVVAGVEGSHLMHGVLALDAGSSLVTIQPPHRFCAVLKRTTDMQGVHFGYLMAEQTPEGFRVDLDILDRTLDLMPQP